MSLSENRPHFSGTCSSVAVIPAACAIAETRGTDGKALLDALALGLETARRVGDWLGRSHYEAGFHQTGTSGAFGAVLAAGRLAELEPLRFCRRLFGLSHATKA